MSFKIPAKTRPKMSKHYSAKSPECIHVLYLTTPCSCREPRPTDRVNIYSPHHVRKLERTASKLKSIAECTDLTLIAKVNNHKVTQPPSRQLKENTIRLFSARFVRRILSLIFLQFLLNCAALSALNFL